jgi:hypothetical protein
VVGVQAIDLVHICIAGLAGAAVGVVAQRWHARQKIALLEQRVARSEEARNGAVERSAAARDQIAQLSKAISDLRRAHQPARAARTAPATSAEERRALAERALAAADGDNERETDSRHPTSFANTEPMQF